MKVPVEQLRSGDVIELPNGRPVTVERVDEYEAGRWLIVRWWRLAERGEPGFRPIIVHVGERGIDGGRYLGSLAPCVRGSLVTLVRRREGAS